MFHGEGALFHVMQPIEVQVFSNGFLSRSLEEGTIKTERAESGSLMRSNIHHKSRLRENTSSNSEDSTRSFLFNPWAGEKLSGNSVTMW